MLNWEKDKIMLLFVGMLLGEWNEYISYGDINWYLDKYSLLCINIYRICYKYV